MKKILFIISILLTFVACQKEESKKDPESYIPHFSKSVIECWDNSGMTLDIVSDKPASFYGVSFSNLDDPNQSRILFDTDNDIYTIVQKGGYTFEITIKPYIDKSRIVFVFSSKEHPKARPSMVLVSCGNEIPEETKESFEYYSW